VFIAIAIIADIIEVSRLKDSGLRRRVIAEIYQMLKKGEYPYGRDPRNHQMKMAQYQHFLENQKKR
jgi:hypothetical protein